MDIGNRKQNVFLFPLPSLVKASVTTKHLADGDPSLTKSSRPETEWKGVPQRPAIPRYHPRKETRVPGGPEKKLWIGQGKTQNKDVKDKYAPS